MKILPRPLEFEWDTGNIDKNWIKHKVTNKEAEEVVENDLKFIIGDFRHSIKERRFQLWGKTNNNRKLNIIFTIRNSKVRIISARDMNKKEKKAYEEKIKANTKI